METKRIFSFFMAFLLVIGMIPVAATPVHAISTVATVNIDGAEHHYTDLQEAIASAAAIGTTAAQPGVVKLTKNVTISDNFDKDKAFSVPADRYVTLDLNDYVIFYNLDNGGSNCKKGVALITCNGNLTLTDSAITKTTRYFKISTMGNELGRAIGLYEQQPNAETYITVEGGCIAGGWCNSGKGGAVCVNGGGTFNMEGGNICGNVDDINGGGVCVKGNGTFNMTGGNIFSNSSPGISNTSPGKGGGVCVTGGEFNMSGGKIFGNNAGNNTYEGYGGGVYLEHATFNMTGGEISGNTSSMYAGGVYCEGSNTTFTM